MTKYVCINSNGGLFLVDEIYSLDHFLKKEDGFEDYIELYMANIRIGGWWLDLEKFFVPLSEWRNNQINSIFND